MIKGFYDRELSTNKYCILNDLEVQQQKPITINISVKSKGIRELKLYP